MEIVPFQRPRPEDEPSEAHIAFVYQAALIGMPRRLMAAKMHLPVSRLNNWIRRGLMALTDDWDADERPPTDSMIALAESFQNGEADRAMILLDTVHKGALQDPKTALALLERTVPEFQRRTAVSAEVPAASGREALGERLRALKAGS